MSVNGRIERIWLKRAHRGKMDEAHEGLQAALRPNWNGGVFAQVIDGGIVRAGDEIVWEIEHSTG